jgi:hypothetical protein
MIDDNPDAFETEPARAGHSLLATIVCVLLLLLSRCGGASSERGFYSNAEMMGVVVGGGLIGLVLWGIAYAITIRRASSRWKVASLCLLLSVGLWTGAANVAARKQAFDRDLAASKLLFQQAQGRKPGTALVIPAGAGTLTRMAAASMNASLADIDRQVVAQRAAGLADILQLRVPRTSPPVLEDCARFDALMDNARAKRATDPLHIVAARAVADADVAAGKIDRSLTDNVLNGMKRNRYTVERRWDRLAAQAQTASQVCVILARRHWITTSDGAVAFTNQADVAAVNAVLRRLDAVPVTVPAPPAATSL